MVGCLVTMSDFCSQLATLMLAGLSTVYGDGGGVCIIATYASQLLHPCMILLMLHCRSGVLFGSCHTLCEVFVHHMPVHVRRKVTIKGGCGGDSMARLFWTPALA